MSWIMAVGIGLAAGTLSGMFGIGGGLVTTPAIRLLLGQPELIAVGTPLAVIVPTAVAGAVAYARRGLADVRAGITIGLAGGAFSVAGAFAASLVGGTFILILTAGVICWAAAEMLFKAARPPRERERCGERAAESPTSWKKLAALGAVAGGFSGLLGLGGGFIVVPALTRYFGIPLKRAAGTSLVAVSLLAVPGSLTHHALGNVDPGLALLLVAGVVPGAVIGARITAIAHERVVRVGFAFVLMAAGVILAMNEFWALLNG